MVNVGIPDAISGDSWDSGISWDSGVRGEIGSMVPPKSKAIHACVSRGTGTKELSEMLYVSDSNSEHYVTHLHGSAAKKRSEAVRSLHSRSGGMCRAISNSWEKRSPSLNAACSDRYRTVGMTVLRIERPSELSIVLS